MKIIYTDRYTFGGFDWGGNRLFFVIPCLRISFVPFQDSFELVFGFGILFWEFVWRFVLTLILVVFLIRHIQKREIP